MPETPQFSAAEKLRSVEREIGQRRHVYPRLVAAGKMRQAAADREIAIMEAVAADYRAQTTTDAPRLL